MERTIQGVGFVDDANVQFVIVRAGAEIAQLATVSTDGSGAVDVVGGDLRQLTHFGGGDETSMNGCALAILAGGCGMGMLGNERDTDTAVF